MTQHEINTARRTTSPTQVGNAMRERRRLAPPKLHSRDRGAAAAGAPLRRWSVAELIAEATTRRAG